MKQGTFHAPHRYPVGSFEYEARRRRAWRALYECVAAQVDADWETLEGEKRAFSAMADQAPIVGELRKIARFEDRRRA